MQDGHLLKIYLEFLLLNGNARTRNMVESIKATCRSKIADMVSRQTIGISMGTNCAPLVADLFLFLL